MNICKRFACRKIWRIAAACVSLVGVHSTPARPMQAQAATQQSAQTPAGARPVGTIKSISGNIIVLSTDAGSGVSVQVQDATKLVRIAPGQTDLKDVTPIQLADIQPGDRVLVRGKLANYGTFVVATSIHAMKKTELSATQSPEHDDRTQHGPADR